MTKHRLTTLVMIVVLGTIGTPGLQTWGTVAITQDSEEQSMGLPGILCGLGRDNDCFFTIEDGWKEEDDPGNRLEAQLTLEKGGLVQELARLTQEAVPNFSAHRDGLGSEPLLQLRDLRDLIAQVRGKLISLGAK